MKTFFKNLISSSDETSSKRVIALISLIVLIGMVIVNASNGKIIDSNLIYVFAGLCGGASIMSTFEKFKS